MGLKFTYPISDEQKRYNLFIFLRDLIFLASPHLARRMGCRERREVVGATNLPVFVFPFLLI